MAIIPSVLRESKRNRQTHLGAAPGHVVLSLPFCTNCNRQYGKKLRALNGFTVGVITKRQTYVDS